jgi:CheY-like chemotaxis protein
MPHRNGATREARPGLDVLVVDDNRDAADSLAILLDLWGHRTRTAYDADAALDAVADEPPDVVLLELGLKGRDAFALGAHLRSRPGMRAARLFAVSGYSVPAHRDRALGGAFDDFLLKPFEPNALRLLLVDLQAARQPQPS